MQPRWHMLELLLRVHLLTTTLLVTAQPVSYCFRTPCNQP